MKPCKRHKNCLSYPGKCGDCQKARRFVEFEFFVAKTQVAEDHEDAAGE